MDSLDAQCLLMQLTKSELPTPELWRHERSGALSCRYEGPERTSAWPAEDVAKMARAWRDSGAEDVPEQARLFRNAHERLMALAREAGLGPADAITQDHGRREIRGIWEKEKLVLIVDEIPDGDPTAAR